MGGGGAKRLVGAKRLGGKRLGGEMTRGRNGLGAKRPGFEATLLLHDICDNRRPETTFVYFLVT